MTFLHLIARAYTHIHIHTDRVSCNCHSRMEPIGLWEKLSKVVAEVDCIVHLGDQVYADMDLVAR